MPTFLEFLPNYDTDMARAATTGGVAITTWDLSDAVKYYYRTPEITCYRQAMRRAHELRAVLNTLADNLANYLQMTPQVFAAKTTFTPTVEQWAEISNRVTASAGTIQTRGRQLMDIELTRMVYKSDFSAFCRQIIDQTSQDADISTLMVSSYALRLKANAGACIGDWGGGFNLWNKVCKVGRAASELCDSVTGCITDPILPAATWCLAGNNGGKFDELTADGPSWALQRSGLATRIALIGTVQQRFTQYNGADAAVKLWRYVSDGEKGAIAATGLFSQGQTTLEFTKWFTTDKNSVGGGVLHDWVIEITLKPGAFEALTGQVTAQNFRDYMAMQPNFVPPLLPWMALNRDGDIRNFVVEMKENESASLGLHEDALGLFNTMVATIAWSQRVGGGGAGQRNGACPPTTYPAL